MLFFSNKIVLLGTMCIENTCIMLLKVSCDTVLLTCKLGGTGTGVLNFPLPHPKPQFFLTEWYGTFLIYL